MKTNKLVKIATVLGLLVASISYAQERKITGQYQASNGGCDGGFVACDFLTVKKQGDGKFRITFGSEEYSDYVVELNKTTRSGEFSFDQSFDDDCQDPGCGNMLNISGKLQVVGGKPVITATFEIEFSHPEEPGDREGTISKTIEFSKE